MTPEAPTAAVASRRGRRGKWTERTLWTIGLVALTASGGMLAFGSIGGAAAEREAVLRFAQTEGPAETSGPAPSRAGPPAEGEVLGWLEVPRLGIETAVLAGTTEKTLLRAPGHIPGTALPGEAGNIGIAAHRDLHFRALRDVRAGDRIRLRSISGESNWTVVEARVVEPGDLSVLAQRPVSRLTLVTCYPFGWIGRAPKRFVVSAVPAAHGPPAAAELR